MKKHQSLVPQIRKLIGKGKTRHTGRGSWVLEYGEDGKLDVGKLKEIEGYESEVAGVDGVMDYRFNSNLYGHYCMVRDLNVIGRNEVVVWFKNDIE